MIKFKDEASAVNKIMEAIKSEDENSIREAWQSFHDSIAEQIKADFEEATAANDSNILMQRGYRQLTADETKFYQKLINALKDNNPKQAFATIIGTNAEDVMPSTVFEDVYRNLQSEHPLLSKINMQYVGYATKWIQNDHSTQRAVWGAINSEITKEITSSFKVVDVHQNKLSAYACIELGMLDLGPVFLDNYIRTVLTEALAVGLEYGAVKGNGLNEPIGLVKDISSDVSVNQSTGYPDKEKVAVTDFTPETYGTILAEMATSENGNPKRFSSVCLICNQKDYLTKIMPATTLLNSNGAYVNNVFPFPTDVIVSNALSDGEAVLALLDEYDLLAGGSREGVIEYSDEYKFVEDLRYFKIKQYATGRAFDNTSALFLDISSIEPAYLNVKTINSGENDAPSV